MILPIQIESFFLNSILFRVWSGTMQFQVFKSWFISSQSSKSENYTNFSYDKAAKPSPMRLGRRNSTLEKKKAFQSQPKDTL